MHFTNDLFYMAMGSKLKSIKIIEDIHGFILLLNLKEAIKIPILVRKKKKKKKKSS